MRRVWRFALAPGAVAAVVVLFFVLRPEDDDGGAGGSPLATRGTATSKTGARNRPRPGAAARGPRPLLVAIAVRNRRPVGGVRRVRLERGRRVVLVVRSDVRDHVHVHGYDVFRNVAPGSPARIGLRATLTGRFEIELEDRGVPIAHLEVSP